MMLALSWSYYDCDNGNRPTDEINTNRQEENIFIYYFHFYWKSTGSHFCRVPYSNDLLCKFCWISGPSVLCLPIWLQVDPEQFKFFLLSLCPFLTTCANTVLPSSLAIFLIHLSDSTIHSFFCHFSKNLNLKWNKWLFSLIICVWQ